MLRVPAKLPSCRAFHPRACPSSRPSVSCCSARGPDLYIAKEQFRETFCADVPVDLADVMFATQRPLSLAALTETATAAGWKTKPSWFLVSEHDNAIPPDAERFMAERMGAATESISGSHAAFIANPVRVASFITKALAG
jgi:pimeloyl-ACP methyl ester carboxylesterase